MPLSSVVPLALLGPEGPMRDQLGALLGQGIGHVAGIGLLGHKLPAEIATGMTLPAQQVVGFARLDLRPGEAKTVTFVVPLSLLAYSGLSGEVILEPGPVELGAGRSSDDIRSGATLTVTGRARPIAGEARAFLSATIVGPDRSP